MSGLWKRGWGHSWVGVEIVPQSAALSLSERRDNVNNKAFCYFRCQGGTADNNQLTLQPHEWSFEGSFQQTLLFCFTLNDLTEAFFFFFLVKGAVFNEQPVKVCRRLNIQWHTDIVGNSPANTVWLLSNQKNKIHSECNYHIL